MAQLGPGKAKSSAVLYQTGHVRYNEFRLNTAFEQSLHGRADFVSFGLMLPDSPVTWVGDKELPSDGLVVFPSHEDINAASPVGFGASGLHFSRGFLESLTQAVYRAPLLNRLPQPGIYLFDLTKLRILRGELFKWRELAALSAIPRASVVDRREESLALAVLDGLDTATEHFEGSWRSSDRLLNRALEMIHNSNLESLRISQICTSLGCSRRALEKNFSKRFGITPKRYIKCQRLAQVRRELLNEDPQDSGSIIELAANQGFWHMGQFAADYRNIYGELPSQTLKRT